MTDRINTHTFLSTVIQQGLYSNVGNLRFHLETLFGGIRLDGATLLDIGGGNGIHSFYAAARGARDVVCLEPEAMGSGAGVTDRFRRLGDRLALLDRVTLEPTTFQAYDAGPRRFDVVLLHNAVNHLDEAACMALPGDPSAREAYREIFAKIGAMSKPGATLVLCDCSNANFFARLGLRNPIEPTIEWHKHQPPEVWAALLNEVGFSRPRISWSSFNRLRSAGRWLTGNRLAAFFLTSHFRLVATWGAARAV